MCKSLCFQRQDSCGIGRNSVKVFEQVLKFTGIRFVIRARSTWSKSCCGIVTVNAQMLMRKCIQRKRVTSELDMTVFKGSSGLTPLVEAVSSVDQVFVSDWLFGCFCSASDLRDTLAFHPCMRKTLSCPHHRTRKLGGARVFVYFFVFTFLNLS